jgi:hypothetical protein
VTARTRPADFDLRDGVAVTSSSPSAADLAALARPMPDPAPVTTATLSSNLLIGPRHSDRRGDALGAGMAALALGALVFSLIDVGPCAT